MDSQDQLFLLISTLSKSEKRFFKIYSSRHVIGEQNNYVRLFDFIDKLKKYDEAAILANFKGEKFINRLSVSKSYLYDLILKSMNVFHASNSVDAQIKELLRSVEFLFDKGLYKQAIKLVEKARKLAEKFQKLDIMPEVINWVKKLWEANHYAGIAEEDLNLLYQEEKELGKMLSNINEYWKLQSKLYYLHNIKGIVRTPNDLDKFEDIFNSQLMANEENAISSEAKALFCKIYATYFFIVRDFESCYRYIKQQVELLEQNPEVIKETPLDYINALHNLLNISDPLEKKEEFEKYLNVLKEMLEDDTIRMNDNVRLRIFEGYFYHQLKSHVDNEMDPKAGLSLVKEMENGLNSFSNKISGVSELMLSYYAFWLCFKAEDLEAANIWSKRILQPKFKSVRPDVYGFAKILNLMLQFDREIPELKQTIKSTYRFLSNSERQYEFENQVLDFIRLLPNVKNSADLNKLFINSRIQLDKLETDPFQRKAFAYFDFKGWVDKKIEQKAAII